MDALRLFFAIELSDSLRNNLQEITNNLKKESFAKAIRWSYPENLHITLRFVGSFDINNLPLLDHNIRVKIKNFIPFEIQFEQIHLFPSRHPKVISLNLNPNEELFNLAEEIEKAVAESGAPPETRAFFPHLTLGRVLNSEKLRGIIFPRAPKLNLAVNHFSLMNSEEKNGKRIYTPLIKFNLGS